MNTKWKLVGGPMDGMVDEGADCSCLGFIVPEEKTKEVMAECLSIPEEGCRFRYLYSLKEGQDPEGAERIFEYLGVIATKPFSEDV